MVALELFTISSLYTAGNAAKYFAERYGLMNGKRLTDGTQLEEVTSSVEKFVELSAEKASYSPPFYVNPGGQAGGIGIPIGGGTTTEFQELLTAVINQKDGNAYNWHVTDLESRQRCAPAQKFWLNTPDDLKTFFDQHRIPQNIIPLSIPLQVREIKIPSEVPTHRVGTNSGGRSFETPLSNTTLYTVQSATTIGSHKASVADVAAWSRTFGRRPTLSGLAALTAICSGAIVYTSWDDYYERQRRADYLKKILTLG
jgi:hypothetical protein